MMYVWPDAEDSQLFASLTHQGIPCANWSVQSCCCMICKHERPSRCQENVVHASPRCLEGWAEYNRHRSVHALCELCVPSPPPQRRMLPAILSFEVCRCSVMAESKHHKTCFEGRSALPGSLHLTDWGVPQFRARKPSQSAISTKTPAFQQISSMGVAERSMLPL